MRLTSEQNCNPKHISLEVISIEINKDLCFKTLSGKEHWRNKNISSNRMGQNGPLININDAKKWDVLKISKNNISELKPLQCYILLTPSDRF